MNATRSRFHLRNSIKAIWLTALVLLLTHLPDVSAATPSLQRKGEGYIYNKVRSGGDKRQEDREKLGKAMEYFKSGKYHEAYLLYSYLDSLYTLSQRTRAFLGVSAYYDGDYATAVNKLADIATGPATAYPPAEMSVYCYCCAESLFRKRQFARAMDLFERYLCMCKANERTEALVRIGQCHIEAGEWEQALEALDSAEQYSEALDNGVYRTARERLIARLTDICKGNMTNGTIFANKSSTGIGGSSPKGGEPHESITETKKTDKK